MPGTDPSDPDSLENGRDSADQQGRTTIRLAIVEGPPPTRAATQTAMKAPEVPMMSTCPAPTRPTPTAWRTVVTPLTSRAAKTAHDK